jgi:N-acetylglucosaminyl-diphospho-decaprenol L-rhamnosyltransferase
MPHDVLVVIVTYNSADVIAALLDSLPAGLGDVAADVVVVDNGSSDGTRELLSQRSDCRLIESENVGYAAGINLGVAAAGEPAEAVLVLNPDVVLESDCVPLMLRELRSPGVGIVTPVVREVDGSVSWSLRREPTLLRNMGLGRTRRPLFSEYVTEAAAYQDAGDIDWAVGAVLLVSWECHQSLGGWDESFFLYSEETDFCLRARDQGFATRFCPEAAAMHIGGASGQSGATHAMEAVNRVRLYRRRHGALASGVYLLLSVASELSWWVRGNEHSPAAVRALISPAHRPPQLGTSDRLLPR